MNRKPPIGIIVVLALVGITFMIWSVSKSKQKSGRFPEDLNKVDNSSKESNDSLQKANDTLILK
jgi:hypothetical protein